MGPNGGFSLIDSCRPPTFIKPASKSLREASSRAVEP